MGGASSDASPRLWLVEVVGHRIAVGRQRALDPRDAPQRGVVTRQRGQHASVVRQALLALFGAEQRERLSLAAQRSGERLGLAVHDDAHQGALVARQLALEELQSGQLRRHGLRLLGALGLEPALRHPDHVADLSELRTEARPARETPHEEADRQRRPLLDRVPADRHQQDPGRRRDRRDGEQQPDEVRLVEEARARSVPARRTRPAAGPAAQASRRRAQAGRSGTSSPLPLRASSLTLRPLLAGGRGRRPVHRPGAARMRGAGGREPPPPSPPLDGEDPYALRAHGARSRHGRGRARRSASSAASTRRPASSAVCPARCPVALPAAYVMPAAAATVPTGPAAFAAAPPAPAAAPLPAAPPLAAEPPPPPQIPDRPSSRARRRLRVRPPPRRRPEPPPPLPRRPCMRLPALRALPSEPPTLDAPDDMPSRAPWCAAHAPTTRHLRSSTPASSAPMAHTPQARRSRSRQHHADVAPRLARDRRRRGVAGERQHRDDHRLHGDQYEQHLDQPRLHSRSGGQIDAARAAGRKSTAM